MLNRISKKRVCSRVGDIRPIKINNFISKKKSPILYTKMWVSKIFFTFYKLSGGMTFDHN